MLAKPVAPIPVLGQAEWEALMSPEQILRMFATPPERLTREQMRALGFDPGPPPTDAEMDDVEDTEDDEIGFGKYP
jgi:hypothetical protein